MLKMNEKAPSRISDDYSPVKTEKQTLKSEIAKMKSLGFKGGLEYFWMYYHIPTLILILVIACGISIGVSVYENSKPVLIYGNFVNNGIGLPDGLKIFEEKYTNYLGEDPDKTNITLETGLYYSVDDANGQNQVTYQKLMAEIGAGSLDFLGGDKEFFYNFNDKLGDNRYCMNLTDVLPPDLYEMFQNRFYYVSNPDGTQVPVGIDITNSPFYSDMQMQGKECYIGAAVSCGNINNFLNFLRYCYNLPPVLESDSNPNAAPTDAVQNPEVSTAASSSAQPSTAAAPASNASIQPNNE